MADLSFKVLELENIIKMKDLELRMKDEQIKLLNDTINILKQKETPIIEKETPIIQKEEVSQEETLISRKVTRPIKRATNEFTFINIEDFFQGYIQNTENKYIFVFENSKTKFIALKPQYYRKEYSCFDVMTAIMDIITDAINKLPKNKSFCKVCDKSRKKIQIKTNNEIIPSSNQEEIDKLIFKLFKDTYEVLFNAFTRFNNYFAKNWVLISSDETDLYYSALEKRSDGLPLTNQEEAIIKRKNTNNKIKNEFEELTGVDYELLKSHNGWFSNLSLSFYSFDDKQFKSGFLKLKTYLATGTYDKNEIEDQHKKRIQYNEEQEENEAYNNDSDMAEY